MHICGHDSVNCAPAVALNWLEDETFFSVCSRQHVIWGSSDAMTTFRRLFKSEGSSMPHDFPHSLDALQYQMREVLGDPEKIICRHTIFPFFRPFQSQEHIQAALETMKGSQLGSIKYKLGLVTGRFGAEHPLKACHACIKTDVNTHGIAYWHLCHQYPGVIICPIHEQILQESTHNRQWSGRFRWTLPEKENLTSWPCTDFDPITQRALLQLVRSILDLATVGNFRSFDPFVVRWVYRNALREMGLLNSISQKAAPSLANYSALLQPYHPLTSLPSTAQKACTYIEQLIRKPRGHSHPLKHLVMITWLFGQVSDFIEAYDRAEANWERATSDPAEGVDQDVQLARPAEPTGPPPRKLKPKVLKPPVRAEILRFLCQGISKNYICSQFRITVSTVNKLLRAEPLVKKAWTESRHIKTLLEHRSEWTSLINKHPNSSAKFVRTEDPKLYAWLYRNDKPWLLQETARLPTGRIGNNSNINWTLRDEALKALLIATLSEDATLRSNKKLSNKDIYTLTPKLSICLKARNQYPRTRALLREVKNCRQSSKLHISAPDWIISVSMANLGGSRRKSMLADQEFQVENWHSEITTLTLPHERTRAIVKTEEFLRELARNPELPQDIRSYAKRLLRHYPSADQILSLGRLEECLESDTPDDEFRRRVIAWHQPLLSSSLEPKK